MKNLMFFIFLISVVFANNFLDLTNENFLEVFQDTSQPLLINLILGDCSQIHCRRVMEENNELAKVVKAQNRVAMVDCANEKQLCSIMPKGLKKKNNFVTFYINDNKMF